MDAAWSSLSARLRISSHEGSIHVLFHTNVSALGHSQPDTVAHVHSSTRENLCRDTDMSRSTRTSLDVLVACASGTPQDSYQRLTIPCSTQSYCDSEVRQILTPILQALTVLQLPIPHIHDIIASTDALQLECRARRLCQRT